MKKPIREKVTLDWLERRYQKVLRRIDKLKRTAGTYFILMERLRKEIEAAPQPYVKEK